MRTEYEDVVDPRVRPDQYVEAHEKREYHGDREGAVYEQEARVRLCCSVRLER